MQIVIAVMHLGRHAVGSEALSVLVSFQILLLWVKIQYFARYNLSSPVHTTQMTLLTICVL